MSTSAVVLAAGRGERMRSDVRKAFLELAGRPLFVRAVETFARVPQVEEIVVVVHPDDVRTASSAVGPIAPRARIVAGGETRRDSSLAGIRASTGEIALIHDGCRPFVTAQLIERVLGEAKRHGAAVPVLPSTETLYHLADGRLARVLDRASVVRAQTPQGFSRPLILRCLEAADRDITDDASALLAQGEPVFVVEGEASNVKLTYPEDLRWARTFAASE